MQIVAAEQIPTAGFVVLRPSSIAISRAVVTRPCYKYPSRNDRLQSFSERITPKCDRLASNSRIIPPSNRRESLQNVICEALNCLRTQSNRRSSTIPLFTILTNRQQVPPFTNLPLEHGTIGLCFWCEVRLENSAYPPQRRVSESTCGASLRLKQWAPFDRRILPTTCLETRKPNAPRCDQ